MAGQEKDAQTICLKHGQRVRCIGQGAENLGVADERNFRGVQGFLIDRCCGDSIRFAVHGKLDALFDVGKSRLAAHSLDNAIGELRLVDVVEVDQIEDSGTIVAVSGFVHDIDLEVRAHDADRSLHDLTVADGDHIRCIIDFFQRTCLGNDLGAYTGGITNRYCNDRFSLFHYLFPLISLKI